MWLFRRITSILSDKPMKSSPISVAAAVPAIK
jgi:hypothetical protein